MNFIDLYSLISDLGKNRGILSCVDMFVRIHRRNMQDLNIYFCHKFEISQTSRLTKIGAFFKVVAKVHVYSKPALSAAISEGDYATHITFPDFSIDR